MELLATPEFWIALLTLTALEIVLGIDNVIFISIMAGKLPLEKQKSAMRVGLGLAMLTRIALLFSLSILIGLTAPLVEIFQQELSGRDFILIVGGLFLLGKSTHEIHQKLEGQEESSSSRAAASFTSVIIQIMLLDVVFSIDSVITAIGLAEELSVMVAAIIIAVGVMLVSAQAISAFVHEHPTVKMLALSFLLLIGVSLVAEGFDQHIPKGYIYFAMAFSVFVEMVNLRIRRAPQPVELRGPQLEDVG